MSWLKSIQARARLLFGRGAAESRMEEELSFHLEMEKELLMREEGLDAGEARRRARVVFGGQDAYREAMRDGRGAAWLSGLRLDLKLGVRMLLKYPVLTVASVLALAIAIALAASWFEFMSDMSRPRIALPAADRLVQIRTLDVSTGESEPKSLHDFETWRSDVKSLTDLSATSMGVYNLTTDDGRFATLNGVRVTSSMFRLAGVRPLLGRTLASADYEADAEAVVVLGHGAWQRLFDGDRSAVGSTVRLGSEYATVVGVMPAGFAFPLNQEIWTPLRASALSYERRDGPRLGMFGRLAPGVSLAEARAELRVIGERTAAAYPATHEHIRPEIRRFGRGNDMATAAVVLNIPFLLFLLVVCANVATLLIARTAARESEIALRVALGASRSRVILQLIVEALVLTSLAAALGLFAAHHGLRWGMDLFWDVQQMRAPFWFGSGVSASGVLYVCILAVLGAVIIGALPGLRATRRHLRDLIGQPGGSGMKFGAVATGVIIVQVALCVAFIPVAIMSGEDLLPAREAGEFPADAYLSGRLTLQHDQPGAASGAPDAERGAELFDEVQRRLAAEPGVLAATRASRLAGLNHPVAAIETDDDPPRIVRVRPIAVQPDFFDVMGARIVSGRAFDESDVAGTVGAAVVDQAWAREMFGARNAVGRRIRYSAGMDGREEVWHEIVGLVAGMDRATGPGERVVVFHPLRAQEHASVQIYVRTDSRPAALAPQVHDLVAAVDPRLAVVDLMPLEDTWRPVRRSNAFFAAALIVVSLIIVLFALMGIYALTSFSVAQRTREIGIRAALGANPRRILLSIFARALTQIGLGIVAGTLLVSLTVARSPEALRLVVGVAAAMATVGLIGCTLPARRALRIQPIEALRAE